MDGGAAFGDVFEGEGGFGGRRGGGEGGVQGDVAALDHEAWYESVEWGVVVCAAGAEGDEVLYREIRSLV